MGVHMNVWSSVISKLKKSTGMQCFSPVQPNFKADSWNVPGLTFSPKRSMETPDTMKTEHNPPETHFFLKYPDLALIVLSPVP